MTGALLALTLAAWPFPVDASLHASVGAGLGIAAYQASAATREPAPIRALLALGTVAAIGAGKEGLDRAMGGEWSWTDLAADAIGALIGIGVGWLVERVFLAGRVCPVE